MIHQPEAVSLVCTVRDEADNIAALLDSMLAQRRMPDEIVVNDCGSRDATAAIVREYAAREPRIRLVAGGHNIPSGRNNAIAAAAGPLIACTDAGLLLDREWLAQIIAPLEQQRADLVGGFFRPAPRTLFELALGATNYRHADEIDPAGFLPFGKSLAVRKAVWAAVGGFPEWASHCEDLLFDLAVERAGYRRAFVPEALVYFRPRGSFRAFARQYFLYARGDGRAGLWPQRHLARYGTYGTLAALLLTASRSPVARLPIAALLLAGGATYTRGPYRRLWPQTATLTPGARFYTLALVPLIRLVGDCAKMVGYPMGVVRRLIGNSS
jgi:glycosyltransferase involved in cell wall biosynthesis